MTLEGWQLYQDSLLSGLIGNAERNKTQIKNSLLGIHRGSGSMLEAIIRLYPQGLEQTNLEAALRVGVIALDDQNSIGNLYTEIVSEIRKSYNSPNLELEIEEETRRLLSAPAYIDTDEAKAWTKYLDSIQKTPII